MELCKAIILKTSHYSDTQKMVYAYSQEKGYITFISSSFLFRQKKQPIQLMQISEIEYIENAKTGIHKLQTISPLYASPNIYFDIIKMNILLLWGEVLHLILRHEEKNETLFQFITESIEYLNETTQGIGNFNLLFFYRLSGIIGYRIQTDSWQAGYLFNVQDGCFYPSGQQHGEISGPNTAHIIYKLCTGSIQEIMEIPLNQHSRNILLDIVLLYFSGHLNINFNIKSINVIREVFKT